MKHPIGDSFSSYSNVRTQHGFTLVELLIVIVVIAILAAISIVAYNGIQDRSKDSARQTTAAGLKKALELYNADQGTYPAACSGGPNIECNITDVTSYLVPKYIAALPTDPDGKPIYYVYGTGATSYGLRFQFSKGNCKYVGGANPVMAWWGTSTPLCP